MDASTQTKNQTTNETTKQTRKKLTEEEKKQKKKEYMKEWLSKNKQKMAEHAKNYYDKHKDDPEFKQRKALSSLISGRKRYEEYKQLRDLHREKNPPDFDIPNKPKMKTGRPAKYNHNVD